MEKIDSMLQEALSPTQEMSDELKARVLIRVSERKEQTMENQKKNKWRVWKPAMVAAACAALILGATIVPDLFEKNTIQGNGGSGVSSSVGNSFTIKALAATKEMKKEASLDVNQNDGQSIWLSHLDNRVGGKIQFPILCDGTNIEKITYSVNKGFFAVNHKKGDGYVVDGKKTSNPDDVSGFLPEALQPYNDKVTEALDKTNNDNNSLIVKKANQEYEKEASKYEQDCYSEFSVSPGFQESDDTSICFSYEETVSKSIFDQILDNVNLLSDDGPEMTEAERDKHATLLAESYNKIFDQIKITCTATFKDGSKKSIDVAVHAKAMTPEEAKALNGWSFDKKHVYPVYSVI